MGWKPADSIGVALFNYDAQNSHQLSLTVGDLLCVLEEHSGWLRGYRYYQPSNIGVFPANFVEIKESVSVETTVGKNHHSNMPRGNEVAMEASVALKAWQPKLVEYYISGQTDKFRRLLRSMEEVIAQRGNISHSTATLDVLLSMKTKLTARIDAINHQLDCPLTPRDSEGSKVNCHKISAQKLYQIHVDRTKELDAGVTHTGSLQRKSALETDTLSSHLFVQVNHVDHTFPEPCEIFMFLYDKDGRGQLSERFFMSSDMKKKSRDDRPCALFTDLSVDDVQSRNIFLVCQIIRKGKMLLDDKKNISHCTFRRPYACGIVDVSSVLQFQTEGDPTSFQNDDLATYSLPLYLCSANHESDFSTFHDKIVVKYGGKGGQKPGCSILLSLRLFRGELAQLQRDFSLILTKSMQVVNKMGFPEIILPGDVRNDIYITLETGQFEKGHKRAERNVEVAIEVVDGAGKTIARSIIAGAGATPTGEYESFIFYHNNYPRWNETFKLSIPFEMLPDTHLRITFRHVAKNESRDKADKTFAFTFLKIMNDDGSIIKDGLHELYVYKAEANKRWHDPRVYLSQLSRKEDITRRGTKTAGSKLSVSDASYSGSSMVARSFKEYIQLSTLTISTKLTQKVELLMLLKWRQKPQDLGVALTNLMCVDGEEVVKFLQDTLDCLFEILNTNQDVYGLKVFDVLVFIFGLLLDDRYQHFTAVLDIYLTKHFSALLSHKFLLWAFNDCLQKLPPVADQHPKLVRVIQAMRFIFRFMAQSHVLYARQNKREDSEFKEELRALFSTMCTLMGYQENKIRNVHVIQSALLTNLPHILPEVVQVLPVTELATLISHFLSSVRNTHAHVPRDKIEFILAIIDSPVPLLHSPETRKSLLPTFVKLLVEHMDVALPRTNFKSDDPSNVSCVSCVGSLLQKLPEVELGAGLADFEHLVPLLFPVLRLCKQVPKANPLHRKNSVNLIGLLDVMQDTHYNHFFGTQKEMYGNDLKDTLVDFMQTLKVIINGKLFPHTWVSMYLMQNRVLSRALLNISTALQDSFLRAIHFTPIVWDHYFSLCTEFLVQPSLQLEQFTEYQQDQYRKQFGDLRLAVGRHMIVMWHKLKEQKGNFIPDLIGPFLELTLIKQPELRQATLPVVFDIMRCEQTASGNFKRVETEVFDKMDDLLFGGRGDEEYKEKFSELLTAECSASKELSQTGTAFIDSVSRLIGMLLDYRSVATDDSGQGRRMGCMLNLLNFYKEIEKHELYVRYIYKLAELHQRSHSYTEAGFTLLLHAGELEWTSDPEKRVSAVGRYPDQTSLQRKEQLYMDAVQLFSDGKSWECGVPLCKELATLYETTLFDYPKLASILKKQAMFHERIIDLHELRVAPEYFMVGYYGRGFPLFLRSKVFIHRGQPYEKLTSFIKRLTDEFTTAQILKTVTPPDNEIQNSNGMHLQVRSVQAIPEDQPHFKGKQVPDRIVEYYKSNEVQRFTYNRPFHKGKKNKECEFASLWIERTTFTTTKKFPGVISWFEVSATETVELNPLDIALETVSSKNSEIQTMMDQYKANPNLNINPLSMQLNGVIDAAVMGGVVNYDKIFFNADYVKVHPDHKEGVKRLRQLIEEQTKVLAQGLLVHGQRIDPSLRGLHEKLEQCFEQFQFIVYPEKKAAALAAQNKQTASVTRSKTLSRPLPPAPSLGGPTSPAPPLKRPARRATGKPGKITRPPSQSIYEETEFTPSVPVKRSVSSLSAVRGPAPSLPPPRLGATPVSAKNRLSASNSSGGSSEHLESVLEQRVSVVSTDSLEDVGGTDYEPIQDYLVGGVIEESPGILGLSTSLDAPSYPAPPPPMGTPPKPVDTSQSDDDGYTKVNLTPGSMVVTSNFVSSPEWAELPLKPKSGHTPIPRRSPDTATPTNSRLSASPQDFSPPKITDSRGKIVIPPEPTTPPPSPPTGIREVSSPQPRPPSPLTQSKTSPEQPQLPPKKQKRQPQVTQDNVYEFDRLDGSPGNEAQPADSAVYFDHLHGPPEKATPTQKTTPTKLPQDDNQVYFDHLSGPVSTDQLTNSHVTSTANRISPSSQVTQSSNDNADSVYFDHLVSGPPPARPDQLRDPVQAVGAVSPSRKLAPAIPKSQKPLPVLPSEENATYFDHLVGSPPTSPTRKMAPSIPKGQRPLPELPPERSPAELPPKTTSSSSSSVVLPIKKRWPPSPEHEADSAPPPPVPVKKRQTMRKYSEPAADIPDEPARPVPRPRTATLKKSDSIQEVSPPPRPPKQSPSVPSLPPRVTKPANGEPKPPPIPSKPGSGWRK